jgi:hypothetical protein
MPDTEDLYSDLPEDNELAFLKLEAVYREELRKNTEQSNSAVNYLEYVNKTLAAAHALELPILRDVKTPEVGNAVNVFSALSPKIENFVMQVKIRRGRRVKGYSVALDSVTKEKVCDLISQIRSIVDKLEVHIRKKEALYARLTALSDEVDRDRTKYDAYAALAIEMSDIAGKVTRNLNPARKLLENIGKYFSMARDAEDTTPQLRLEAPRRRLPPPTEADVAQPDLGPGSPVSERC